MSQNKVDASAGNAGGEQSLHPAWEGSIELPAEAVSHFGQLPENQFTRDHDSVRTGGSDPSQPLADNIASGAQWSTEQLNPLIPHFADPELDRQSSGCSVVEEGSILGESGRTYHGYKDGTSGYLLPNDAAEQDRLDFQHAMMAHLWDGRLVLAPLPRAPRLALDVATGTGIWALEFARANPTSFVVGTDLSKIQPTPDVPNCLFERMDAEDDWLWTYKFDYVHVRMILAAIRDAKRLLQQAFDALSPGGWIELQDAGMDLRSEDGPQKDDRVATSYLKQWFELLAKGAALHGIDPYKTQHYKEWLIEIGFVDVVEEKFKVACGPWPSDKKAKVVGQYMRVNYLSGMRGAGYKALRSTGMTAEEVEDFFTAARDEVKNGNIRGYTPWYAVYGRKPFDWEAGQRATTC
ncbi:S-adenosyl-L-methionine-dependent methyltransferase [Pestalotiopsis sp. NC0098]|nr:S-adenosyl-L-methionine-dependent methyltransferase [Pestalotiopsis sp. NC0098]